MPSSLKLTYLNNLSTAFTKPSTTPSNTGLPSPFLTAFRARDTNADSASVSLLFTDESASFAFNASPVNTEPAIPVPIKLPILARFFSAS